MVTSSTMKNQEEKKEISLCIPRVEQNTTIKKIKDTINDLSLGIIEKIDVVPVKHNENDYKKIFIHFKSWYNTERTKKIKDTLINGQIIKVFHDEPWFWKISINKSKLIH